MESSIYSFVFHKIESTQYWIAAAAAATVAQVVKI